MNAADELEFRDFVVARSGALLRTAYLLTGDEGEAQDAVQAALTSVYLSWQRIQHRQAVDAYARRTLIREIGSWRRRKRIQQVLTDRVPEPVGAPGGGSGIEDRDLLQAALLRLSARQRAVVVLRFYVDMGEAEVGEALGISVGAVKQHASRGLDRLRTVLEANAAVVRSERE